VTEFAKSHTRDNFKLTGGKALTKRAIAASGDLTIFEMAICTKTRICHLDKMKMIEINI
jgi:hypothetical protein